MTECWQLRPAALRDLAAVVDTVEAEDLKYRGRSDIELDVVRQQIAADPNFDIEQDLLVVEADGAVVAAAICNPRTLFIAVHPDHESETLRNDLLSWGETRQGALGRVPYRVSVAAANTPAMAMVTGAGYVLERAYASMIRDFRSTGAPEPFTPADGYRLRHITPKSDLIALHTLDDRAFCTRPDYSPETLDEYDKRHISLSTFVPEWSFVAETEAGEMAGSLLCRSRPDPLIGFISLLAVDPDHQRRGLARSLLLASFAAMHAGGCEKAELHVASDNPRALDLYTGVGMSEVERDQHYMRMPG